MLGAITIGECSRIGANAVVVKNVPPDSVVVGIPGRVTNKNRDARVKLPDLNHGKLPDMIEDQIEEIFRRLETVEEKTQNPFR